MSLSHPLSPETMDEILERVLLDALFPHHPYRQFFRRHGRPRLHKFVILRKERHMATIGMTFLNAPTTTETVQALDQFGIAYTGADLANATVATDTPANVGASLGVFSLTTGQATLTLTQAGGEGTANVTISDVALAGNTVSLVVPVQSYTPVLTNFTIVSSVTTPSPAPATTASTPAATTPAAS
jgi:hypothetical protein